MSKIQISDGGVARINCESILAARDGIKLFATTFSVIPSLMDIKRISIAFPLGLHVIVFSYEPIHRDKVTFIKTFLSWYDDSGKLFLKLVDDMSDDELGLFNKFETSDKEIFVCDQERKIAYVVSLDQATDNAWTYKVVSIGTLLMYITKKLTMDDLDKLATTEQAKRDELYDLKCEMVECATELVDLENENKKLKDKVLVVNENYNSLCGTVDLLRLHEDTLIGLIDGNKQSIDQFVLLRKESKWLYNFISGFPVWLRPRAVDGFIEVMDLICRQRIGPDDSPVMKTVTDLSAAKTKEPENVA